MIERIFDKYFTKKLIGCINYDIRTYGLDFKFVKDKNIIRIKCKNKEYSEKYYTNVGIIVIYETLFTILNYTDFIKDLRHKIEEYIRNN